MPRKGENIYKRKDGRWEARYVKGRRENGSVRYGYCYAASYQEVKKKVVQARTAQADPLQRDTCGAEKRRLSSFCDEWLFVMKLRVKDSTLVRYESNIRNHIKPKLGDCPVGRLTAVTVTAFTDELFAEGLSVKSVRDILTLLKAVLHYVGKTCPGVCSGAEIVLPKENRREMRVLTPEEQHLLTGYLLRDMDCCKFGVFLSLMTGLRIGEICALRWENISLEDRTIRVGSAMQRLKCSDPGASGKTRVRIAEPKSSFSDRTIPLTDSVAELCRSFRAENGAAFVLTGTPERYMEPRALQYRLERYTRDCGLEGIHFHTLRHSFATRCVEADFEIKSLSEILGHSNPRITLERYVHSSMVLKRDNMNKLENILVSPDTPSEIPSEEDVSEDKSEE